MKKAEKFTSRLVLLSRLLPMTVSATEEEERVFLSEM